jgi:hypothetical protein
LKKGQRDKRECCFSLGLQALKVGEFEKRKTVREQPRISTHLIYPEK